MRSAAVLSFSLHTSIAINNAFEWHVKSIYLKLRGEGGIPAGNEPKTEKEKILMKQKPSLNLSFDSGSQPNCFKFHSFFFCMENSYCTQ